MAIHARRLTSDLPRLRMCLSSPRRSLRSQLRKRRRYRLSLVDPVTEQVPVVTVGLFHLHRQPVQQSQQALTRIRREPAGRCVGLGAAGAAQQGHLFWCETSEHHGDDCLFRRHGGLSVALAGGHPAEGVNLFRYARGALG